MTSSPVRASSPIPRFNGSSALSWGPRWSIARMTSSPVAMAPVRNTIGTISPSTTMLVSATRADPVSSTEIRKSGT